MSCARRGLACAGPPGLRWPGRLSPPPRRSFVPRGRRGPRGASLPPRRDGAPRPGEGPGVRGREREREREGGRLPRPPPLPSPAGAAPRDPLSGGVGGMPLRCSFHSFCSPRSGRHMSRGGGGAAPRSCPGPGLACAALSGAGARPARRPARSGQQTLSPPGAGAPSPAGRGGMRDRGSWLLLSAGGAACFALPGGSLAAGAGAERRGAGGCCSVSVFFKSV